MINPQAFSPAANLPFGGVQVLLHRDCSVTSCSKDNSGCLWKISTQVRFFCARWLTTSSLFISWKNLQAKWTIVYWPAEQHPNNEMSEADYELPEWKVQPEEWMFFEKSITLTTHNSIAGPISTVRLKKLEGESFVSPGKLKETFWQSDADRNKLELKEGAQVMFIKKWIQAGKKIF